MGYRTAASDKTTGPVMPLAAILATGLILALSLVYVLDDESEKIVDFAGSFIGLILGIGGFGITLWQLAQTRTAAEQASGAVERLRGDIKSLDVISEIHAITNGSANAIALLKSENWSQASEAYEKIRVSLNKITVSHSRLNTAIDEGTAKDFLSHLIGAAGELESLPVGTTLDTAEMRTKLRN